MSKHGHQKHKTRIVIPALAVATCVGCAMSAAPDSELSQESTIRPAKSYNQYCDNNVVSVDLQLDDGRPISSTRVTLEGYRYSRACGGFAYVSDYEDTTAINNCDVFLHWNADASGDLSGGSICTQFTPPQTSESIQIRDTTTLYGSSGMRLTLRAYINGFCHEDWEDIDVLGGQVHLHFDGHNATWDGSCYRGNLLHH
jgi:hypothetical protein